MARNLSADQAPQAPKVFASVNNEVCMVRLSNLETPFSDPRVRQAANHAIDRATIIEQLFGEYAVPANGQIVTEASFGYNPNLQDYPYDPERARALLQEAGYDGEKVEVVGESANRWAGDRDLTLAVVDQLKEVGFNVEADIREWELYLNAIFEEPRAEALFVCPSDDNLTGERVLESFITAEGVQSTYQNPEIERGLRRASAEFDDAARQQQLNDIWSALHEDAAFLPLASVMNIWGASQDVGWTPRRDDLLYLSEVTLSN
jgi:peptide/nickel transport system substrate-binding protein